MSIPLEPKRSTRTRQVRRPPPHFRPRNASPFLVRSEQSHMNDKKKPAGQDKPSDEISEKPDVSGETPNEESRSRWSQNENAEQILVAMDDDGGPAPDLLNL